MDFIVEKKEEQKKEFLGFKFKSIKSAKRFQAILTLVMIAFLIAMWFNQRLDTFSLKFVVTGITMLWIASTQDTIKAMEDD